MKKLKVASGSLNQTPLDWEGNKTRILKLITRARDEGVQILALPELCISAYGCEDMFLSPSIAETALEFLNDIASECKGIVCTLGLPIFMNSAVYNGLALVADGQIMGISLKQNLAGDGIHYEPRWFKPWQAGTKSSIKFKGKSIPVGELLYEIDGVKIGLEICEDAWVAKRPGVSLASRGADIIINASASHFAFGKQALRKNLVRESSRSLKVTYLYSNLLGNESGRAIYDGDLLIASGGKLLQQAKRFSFGDQDLVSAVVDLNLNRMNKAQSYAVRSCAGVADVSTEGTQLEFTSDSLSKELTLDLTESKEDEFTRSVSLGLFDYMRKSRSNGFVVSLSGGADSATVVILVNTMIKLGVAELGIKAFAERCGAKSQTVEELEKELLTCVYQGTENSSKTTVNAAQNLAKELNAKFYNWDIGSLVTGYTELVEGSLGRDLSWEKDDIALQNIQARVRAPGVWMIANLNNALLLSTSNRSEAAVGYSTMDGDTCGGLSPIAGIDKQFLRHWLRWMEAEAVDGLVPYKSLSLINAQKPTAELRPAEDEQTDEEDLMPYDVLDFIEALAIRDKLMPKEICELLEEEFPNETREQISFWLRRFYALWCRNQWKRERYAPSFHLDDKNLDPKTWCRFPILNSGFEYELSKI